ncbi:hypothetical protein AT246_00630 [Bartonella henselae]|nr:hypothetical protein BhenCHDE101_02760 [Bartonella henselae]PNM39362.1 hypothetical protein AL470_002030 [Bartonella henselae str. Houston-1]OLL48086.1 hypothetical protein AT242_03805 [Bartonella henselae]OLL48414.1 hypothetical protein AT241_02955 [Bartonella henselae]OLL48742.1 hypothetical protein AT247_01175 [Bartonella henselae]
MFIKSHCFAFLQLNFTGFSAKPLRLVFFGNPKKKGRVYNSRHSRAKIREVGNIAFPTGNFQSSVQSPAKMPVTNVRYLQLIF